MAIPPSTVRLRAALARTFNVSATKVSGAHTMKSGYAFLESVQRRGNANIQGTYTFSNDATVMMSDREAALLRCLIASSPTKSLATRRSGGRGPAKNGLP